MEKIATKSKSYFKKPKKSPRHGDLANALVEIATEEIAKTKSVDIALRDLAKKLGVSHAAAYRHYKSKKDLFDEIARRGFEKLNQSFLNAPVKNQLEVQGKCYLKFAEDFPGYYRVMFTIHLGPEISERLGGECASAFNHLLKNFGARSKTSLSKAIYAWSVLHGFAMLKLDGFIGDVSAGDLSQKDLELFLLRQTNLLG